MGLLRYLICVTCGITFTPANYGHVTRSECAACGAERRIRERGEAT